MSRKSLWILAFVALTLPILYWLPLLLAHHTATPWDIPSVGPDGRYEVRYFRCFSYSAFRPTMPGGGSDNADGLIRLYDRQSGRLLQEVYRPHLTARQAFWSKDEVLFLGDDGWV